MRPISLIIFTLVFSLVAFSSCDVLQSDARIKATSATPTPLVDNSANAEKTTDDDQNSPDCVRAKPEPIIKKEVFPKTSFRLEKNKEYPFEYLGYETVEFENGDKLLIENVGCENYTLVFHFETARFSHDKNDAGFWYKTAAELMKQTNKGLGKEDKQKNGLKALNSYIKKTEQPKFAEEIDYCGTEIRCVVSLDEVKKLENDKVEIVISFGTGPL